VTFLLQALLSNIARERKYDKSTKGESKSTMPGSRCIELRGRAHPVSTCHPLCTCIFVDPETTFRGKTPAATMACGLGRKVVESPAAAGWNPTEGKNAPLPWWQRNCHQYESSSESPNSINSTPVYLIYVNTS